MVCYPRVCPIQCLSMMPHRPKTVRRRLEAASREMERLPQFDYVVVNERDRLDDAVDQVLAIIRAERCRVGRQPVRI